MERNLFYGDMFIDPKMSFATLIQMMYIAVNTVK